MELFSYQGDISWQEVVPETEHLEMNRKYGANVTKHRLKLNIYVTSRNVFMSAIEPFVYGIDKNEISVNRHMNGRLIVHFYILLFNDSLIVQTVSPDDMRFNEL
jgi:hypothetical protein